MGYVEGCKKLGLLPKDWSASGTNSTSAVVSSTKNVPASVSTNGTPAHVSTNTVPIMRESNSTDTGLDWYDKHIVPQRSVYE